MKKSILILVTLAFFKVTFAQNYLLKSTSSILPINSAVSSLFESPTNNFIGISTNSPIYPLQIEKNASSVDRQMIRVHNIFNGTGSCAGIGVSSGGALNSGSFTQLSHYGANYTIGSHLNDASMLYGTGINGMYFWANNTNSNTQISFKINTTEAMRIVNNGNVGIGTLSPLTKLHAEGTQISSFTGSTRGLLSLSAPYVVGGLTPIDFLYMPGANPTVRIAAFHDGSGSKLMFGTSNNYANGITNTAMTINNVGNVGLGTTSPQSKLDVYAFDNGHYAATIYNSGGSGQGLLIKSGAGSGAGAGLMVMDGNGTQFLKVDNYTGITYVKELKVKLPPFPDFVFEKNYNLMTLTEREKYISSNMHLPYLEPASEIDKNGANIGNTITGVVQNTEELTLYLIEINKKVTEMNKKIELLEKANSKLIVEINSLNHNKNK